MSIVRVRKYLSWKAREEGLKEYGTYKGDNLEKYKLYNYDFKSETMEEKVGGPSDTPEARGVNLAIRILSYIGYKV